jgi:hypothetical protein
MTKICKHGKWDCNCVICRPQIFCGHDRTRGKCPTCRPKSGYRMYVTNAKNRKLSFKLTFKVFLALVGSPCYFCGVKPANGIDQHVAGVGYVKTNCVPCCFICNRMKSYFTTARFLNQISKIMLHMREKNESKETD